MSVTFGLSDVMVIVSCLLRCSYTIRVSCKYTILYACYIKYAMSAREENITNQFLSDTDYNSDSTIFTDETDKDPTFLPGGRQNTPSPSASSAYL